MERPVISDLLLSLVRYERIDDAHQRSLLPDARRPDVASRSLNSRLVNAITIDEQHGILSLQEYVPMKWDATRYEGMGTLLLRPNHAYYFTTSNIAEALEPDSVAYEWSGAPGAWHLDAANDLIAGVPLHEFEIHVLGRPTQRHPLPSWKDVTNVLNSKWHLSRPLRSPMIPKYSPRPIGNNQHAQLAQLVPHSDAIASELRDVSLPDHVNQHPAYDHAMEVYQAPADALFPPNPTARVLVLDRSKNYTSALLGHLYSVMGLPPGQSLTDTFIAGGRHPFDTVLLDARFGTLMHEMAVDIILLADVPTPNSATAALQAAVARNTPIQIVFLSQRAMNGAVTAHTEWTEFLVEQMQKYGSYHQAHPDGLDSMEVDDDDGYGSDEHAQNPNDTRLGPPVHTERTPGPVTLPSPRRDDSEDDESTQPYYP